MANFWPTFEVLHLKDGKVLSYWVAAPRPHVAEYHAIHECGFNVVGMKNSKGEVI